jgi:hypothetical protein
VGTDCWRKEDCPHTEHEPEHGLTRVLLPLAQEVGSLPTDPKRIVRDAGIHLNGDSYVEEALGDVYKTNVETTSLYKDPGRAIGANITKPADRTASLRQPARLGTSPTSSVLRASTSTSRLGPARIFDGMYAEAERLPRQFRVQIAEIPGPDNANASPRVLSVWNGHPYGDVLTDNAYGDDGYRYHDAFHLAHATVLGWSPVVRALLGRKRRSTLQVDEVEDGGRAIAIEEGLSLFVFAAASQVAYFKTTNRVDDDVLQLCRRLTANLEVGVCSTQEWERAILDGYSTWRLLREYRHGEVHCNLDTRIISVRPLTPPQLAEHGEIYRRL